MVEASCEYIYEKNDCGLMDITFNNLIEMFVKAYLVPPSKDLLKSFDGT